MHGKDRSTSIDRWPGISRFISWKFIDAGSKQNTRYAKVSIDLMGESVYYLVVDNRDEGWAYNNEPVLCSISFRSSSDDGSHSQPIQGLRTMPVLRFTLLLFLAALPGWPLFRHYYTLFRSSHRRTSRGRGITTPSFTIALDSPLGAWEGLPFSI